MIKRYFLVAIFCVGAFLVCFAEGTNNTNNGEDKECPQCHGTNEVDCVSCIGTGMQISKCNSCKGTGICQTCKGEGLIECKTCKGKGDILCQARQGKGSIQIIVINPDSRVEEKECPSCNGRGSIKCKACDGKGKITCPTCKGTILCCSTCFGIGIIRGKEKCKGCKGTGKVECKYCESKGKINNPLILTPKDIEDKISNLLKDTEKATDLQKEKICNSVVEKWNKEFAGKIIKCEQKVEQVSQQKYSIFNEKKQVYEDVVTGIIVELRLNEEGANLVNYIKVHLNYEEQLSKISVGDIIVFLIILPAISKENLSVIRGMYGGCLGDRQNPILSVPIGYKKMDEDKLKEFSLPSK